MFALANLPGVFAVVFVIVYFRARNDWSTQKLIASAALVLPGLWWLITDTVDQRSIFARASDLCVVLIWVLETRRILFNRRTMREGDHERSNESR